MKKLQVLLEYMYDYMFPDIPVVLIITAELALME